MPMVFWVPTKRQWKRGGPVSTGKVSGHMINALITGRMYKLWPFS